MNIDIQDIRYRKTISNMHKIQRKRRPPRSLKVISYRFGYIKEGEVEVQQCNILVIRT